MKRRKPINRKNHKRAKLAFEVNFGDKLDWIRALPCCLCLSEDQIQAHHAKSRGAGGTQKDLVPLCWRCHEIVHRSGWKTMEEKTGISLGMTAALLEREYQKECVLTSTDLKNQLKEVFDRLRIPPL